MAFGNTFESEILELILNNVAVPLVGDASGLQPSAADGNLYLALHTADPTGAGNQTTNEVAYTSYARLAMVRDGTKWTVTAGVGENAALESFPACTGGSATATHVSIGTAVSGVGKIVAFGALTSPLAISSGITPEFAAGDITLTLS